MTVEHEKFLLTQQVARLSAQMEAFKRGSSATPRISSPALGPDLTREQFIKQELLDDYRYNLPTPQPSHGAPSISYSSSSIATDSQSSTPATTSLDLDAFTVTPDMTQHPAAMLCDLQCQSAETCQASTRPTTRHTAAIQLYLANLLYVVIVSAVYSQMMNPLRMIFTSSKTGSSLPQPMTTTPMALHLIRWLTSTPSLTKVTTPMPTSTTTSSAKAMSTPELTHSRVPILCLRMLRRLLLSSPALARPLRAATGRALRAKTASMTRGNGARGLGVRRIVRRNGSAGLKDGVRSISRSNRQSGSTPRKMRSQKDRRR